MRSERYLKNKSLISAGKTRSIKNKQQAVDQATTLELAQFGTSVELFTTFQVSAPRLFCSCSWIIVDHAYDSTDSDIRSESVAACAEKAPSL
jgi:hypothetical protein